MPAAVAVPAIAAVVGGGLKVGADIYGAKKQTKANREANELQMQGIREQIAFERERDNEARRQWDAEQQRRAPYREMADSLIRKQAGQFGLSIAPRQPEMPPMPQQQPMSDPLAGLRNNRRPQPRTSGLSALARY